ncbi:hypothetical protein [uncultured Sphingomonas sp.]|nr:hypothetical protein [uncultured Sphingomonas sp.]
MADPPRPEQELIRRRQRSGARATAWVLAAFIILVFLITIAKIWVNR